MQRLLQSDVIYTSGYAHIQIHEKLVGLLYALIYACIADQYAQERMIISF